MSELNQLFLAQVSKQYEIENAELFEGSFSSYALLSNKKTRAYLILCNDFDSDFDVETVLDRISEFESDVRCSNSYLCVMPIKTPATELCTHFNGKSFVHFVFPDIRTNNLVYDKKVYYLGSKHIKKLIDIYQNCFNPM